MLTNLIFVLVLTASCWGAEDEDRLFHFIKYSSHHHVRPVKDASTPLNLTLKFWLFNIHKLDLDDQSFEVIGMLEQEWKDEYATWDPADFGGLTKMTVPTDLLWHPTTKMIPGVFERDNFEMVIKNNGAVTRPSLSKFNTKCRVTPTSTAAICKLVFMPWAHDASEIHLIPADGTQGPPGTFTESNQWKLKRIETAKHVMEYPCCPGVKYGDVTFTIHLKKSTA